MKDQKEIEVDEVKPTEEEVKKAKLKEMIKKFSCHSKTYPPMEWWEFMG